MNSHRHRLKCYLNSDHQSNNATAYSSKWISEEKSIPKPIASELFIIFSFLHESINMLGQNNRNYKELEQRDAQGNMRKRDFITKK